MQDEKVPAQPPSIEQSSCCQSCTKQRVLIVEDELLIGWSLSRALIEEGFEPTIALSGAKAIERLYANQFELVITDTKLPDCTGFDVVTAVKRLSPKAAIIMTSALDSDPQKNESLRSDVNRFVEKPFDLGTMTSIVKQVLNDLKEI